MRSEASTVAHYLSELPADRKPAISKVRSVIRANLPNGIKEAMNWGMIAYEVPLTVVPDTYNGQPLMYAALASQKNHMAVYLSGIYGDPKLRAWFESAYRETGLRTDIGRSCVRFRTLDQLPLHLIGQAISAMTMKQFIDMYRKSRT